MAKIISQQVLDDFMATLATNPNADRKQLMQAFPEFGNDEKLLDAAYDYRETRLQNPMADMQTINSKFPEFFAPEPPVQEPMQQTNPSVAANPAPTTEAQYQANLHQQDAAQGNAQAAPIVYNMNGGTGHGNLFTQQRAETIFSPEMVTNDTASVFGTPKEGFERHERTKEFLNGRDISAVSREEMEAIHSIVRTEEDNARRAARGQEPVVNPYASILNGAEGQDLVYRMMAIQQSNKERPDLEGDDRGRDINRRYKALAHLPEHEAQWAKDEKIFEEELTAAKARGDEAKRNIAMKRTAMHPGAVLLEQHKAYNEETDPTRITSDALNKIAERNEKEQEKAIKDKIRAAQTYDKHLIREQLKDQFYGPLSTPVEGSVKESMLNYAVDKAYLANGGKSVDEIYKELQEEAQRQVKSESKIDDSDIAVYLDFAQKKMYERFVDESTPQSDVEYFVRKVVEGNIIGQLAQLYTSTPAQRAYDVQGLQKYESQLGGWKAFGLNTGASLTGIVLDPLMWVAPEVGGVAGRTAVRAIGGRVIGKMGYAGAEELAARAMVQKGLLNTAQRYASSAATFAMIDAGHDVFNQLYYPTFNPETGQYENASWNPLQTLGAMGKGAATGTLFAGAGILGDKAQVAVGKLWNESAGVVAGRATHFTLGTNAMVGTSVASQLLQGKSIDEINWGREYADAAAMQLFFDIKGGAEGLMRTYSEYAKAGQKLTIPETFRANWEQMKRGAYANTFTQEEIEQFNKAGFKGSNAYQLLLNLNGGKAFESLQDLYVALDKVANDPTIDTQAKYKLASLIYGKVDANLKPIQVDAYKDEQGRYVVRTYDNAGQNYETKYFTNEAKANEYRQQQYDVTRNNLREWQEDVVRNYQFAQDLQDVADKAIIEIQKQYPQYSKEQLYGIMRESLLNSHAERGNAISQNAEADAIRGMFEEYLTNNTSSFFDALKAVRAQASDDSGIKESELNDILSQDYKDLDFKKRSIYDNYLRRLAEAMPNPTSESTRITGELEAGGPDDYFANPQQPQAQVGTIQPTREEVVRQEVVAEVTPNTHKNGYVYPVKQPGENGKAGYIVNGDVTTDVSDPEHPVIANNDVVTVRWEDGTVEQLAAKDLDLISTPEPADNIVATLTEQRLAAEAQQAVAEQAAQNLPEGVVEFTNGNETMAVIDNGDGTYQLLNSDGTPDANSISAEQLADNGYAMIPREQAPQAPVQQVQEQPIVQEPQQSIQTAAPQPVIPNIETMSAEELGGSTVEYMGDKASATAYLEAERDKADAEVKRTSKLKVGRFDGIEDFKRQNDQIQAAKRAAIDRYNKLQNAITAANAYKTLAEQKEEAERKAREAAMREQRRQLAEAEAAGDIEAKWQNTKKTVGFAATKTLPNGQKVNGHYILTEAGDVVPSHDPRKNYADSEGYVMENGQNVNDNNYKDPDVQRIALDIAQNYGGQAVEQMPFLENRAGRVLSGNNRTISGIIAAENNTDQAYLAALAENAQQYGFTPEQLAEYQHPRLQFVVEDELPFTTGTFAMFNQQEKKTKSSVNRAVANSKMVTEAVRDKMLEIMDQYESLDSFFGSESAAADIVQALITEGLMTQQEVAGLTENTGSGFKFGQSGREYVTDMLLGTLFDEQTIKMLAGEKTLKQAILRALPSIVANRRLKGYELTDSINNAIKLLYEARKANEGKSTADAFQLYLRQVDAFKGSVMDRYNGFDIILANRMSAGVEQLREILGLYNNSAMNEANGQMGFFEPRTIDDIKQDVYEYYTNQQPELAAALNGAAATSAQPQSAVPGGVANEEKTRPEVSPIEDVKRAIQFKSADEERFFDDLARSMEQDGENPMLAPVEALATAKLYADRGEIIANDIDAARKEIDAALATVEATLSKPNVTPQEVADAWKTAMDIYDKYPTQEEKAQNPQENLQESEKSSTFALSNGQLISKAEYQQQLGEYLDGIADEAHKPVLFDDDTLIDTLISVGVDENAVRQAYRVINNGGSIEGFFLNGRVCLNVDKLPNQDIARSKYVHERQHDLTRKDVRRVKEVMNAATEDELKALLVIFSNSNLYDDYPYAVVADEFISFAMEEAYKAATGEELTKALQEIGVKDELINIIKSINDEQRSNQSLSMARRTPYLGESAENSGAESRRDSKTRAEGGLVEEGSGIDQSSVRRTESGGRGSSESQVTRSTTDAAEVEIGGALVDRLEDMGLSVSTDLQANRDVLKAAKKDKSEAGAIHYYKTQSGQQYGFSYKGKVYLDQTKINAELPLHEYGHLWAEALRRLNPENWQRVVETIKADKEAWEFVKSLRPELTDENEIAEEVIATFSGKNGAEKMRAEYERMHGKDADYKSKWGNIFKNISKAIQDFWKAVGDFLNIKYESAEQVYDQVLKDFVDNMNPWKRVSDFLRQRDAEYVQAAESGDIKTATNIFYEALKENIGNGITPYMSVGTYNNLKRLAKGVKTRDAALIKEAADLIAPLIPDNAVLIPAPSHSGTATDMLDLAKAIAEVTGSEVADVLRSAPRESQYQAKKTTGVQMASKQLGIAVDGEIPADKTPIIIDNVVDSGNTAEACVQAVGKGVVVTLADSAEQYGHAASLKSAAPVLRDKDGKVIPLSKRFDLSGSRYLGRRMYLRPDDLRLSVSGTQTIPVGKNTLVGLHNISAEKLRKALKMGGLANPSTAVIDIARQNHEQYGDISLIMPSSLVDSTTGRNAGTFTGDIWSPTYPSITKQMSDKGDEIYYQTIAKLFANNDARQPILSRIKLDFDDYLDRDNVRAGLTYWYLLEKGIEPTDIYYNSGVPEEVKERFKPLAGYLSNLNKEEIDQLIAIIADEKGTTVEQMKQDAQEAIKRYRETINNPDEKQFRKNIAQKAIDEIEYYGIPYGILSDAFHRYNNAVQRDGKIDLDATLIAAQDLVQSQYQADFDKWLADMDKRFDIKEVIFTGYDNEGDRKYIPHTLANASKMMNSERLQNAGSNGGLGATRGQLVEKMLSLAEIRANKNRLRPGEEEDHETEEWNKLGDEWFEKILGPLSDMQKISDNPFSNTGYAEQRLQEALFKANPVAYLNKEYGYKIGENSEWAKNLKDLVQRIKSLPTKYFETKFRRPVYLNEFANAVVPNDLPMELRDGLEKAGLTLFEYDPKEEGARRAATLKATEDEGIRFSVSGGLSTDRTLTKAAREEMQQIKDAALADGTFMKSPNGKRSNLNERQWLQVRTRAFKNWFGDWENDPENASKIIDWNGEPMVMYHGRSPIANFTEFMLSPFGRYGEGVYFTSNRLSAENYSRRYGADKGAENVVSAFLNIRNPYNSQVWWASAIKDDLSQYDGLISPNGLYFEENETIVKDPNQIKSATHNDGSFSEENDDIRFSISNQNNDIFYSNAERAVEGIKQEKATPEQWRAMIEKAGGLKAGEDKWIGLSDWLAQQRPTVTPQEGETRSQFVERAAAENKRFTLSKQDLLDYIREHKIQIEEVPYAEGLSTDAEQKLDEFNAEFEELIFEGDEETGSIYTSDWVDYAWRAMVDRYGDDFESAFEIEGEGTGSRLTPTMDYYGNYSDVALYFLGEGESRPINGTRLQYTTDGLQNKREIALVVPTIESWNQGDEIHFGDAGEGRAIAWVRFGDTHKIKEDWMDGEGNLHKGAEALEDVLVIDEIQSKRHQEGREHGYRTDEEEKTLQALLDYERELKEKYNKSDFYDVRQLMTDEEIAHRKKLTEANLAAIKNNDAKAVPAAPFEKNWHELAMKRILRFAAENGYDKVAWTTGEQQAKRYDIGKEIDHIVKTDENTYEVYPTSGLMMTLEFDENGMYADEYDREYNGKSMSDIFGKDLAKRLKEMPVDETLQGDGLRVGYDGMKGFYDDILPRFMQKYGKKWGVQVGEVTMPQLEDGYQTMHSVDITPEMRESVMEGQPMFSITGSRGAANIDQMEGVTTRMDNLAAARQMEEDGKDAKTIRMATGWERGADGKWRYEIDDVQLNTDNVKANFRKLDRRGVTAPMVWYHNKFTDIIADSPERKQLLAAYPQLADLDIEFYDYPNKERGAYSSEKKKISVNRANVRSVDECRSVLLHEIQHAIQEAELFAKGTSKEQIQLTWKLNNEVHNKVDEYFDKMGFKEWLTSHNGDKAFVDRLMQVIHMFPNRDFNIHYLFVETLPRDKQIDAIDVLGDANDVIQSNRDAIYGADRKGMTMKPDELYHNAAGEVESRNVQNRMKLTPEERRERLLAETEDVARKDQVVIMNAFDMANDEVPQTTNRATSNDQSSNFNDFDDQIRFSVVTSRKKIAELEAGEKIKVYRAAQVIDGKLYPPMAAKQQGQLVKPIELGRWEQAEEHPELAKDGKFKLDKANGSSVVPAAYNPYFHTSRSPLNDQFSSAYDRPNLVTLEVEVPASELTSRYKAEGDKDAVGETNWHSGAVSGKLAKAGEPRKVILSRWDKPLRIVPDAEVAEKIAGMLSGKDIAIPYNVVTPSLRAELEKQGVTISDQPSGTVKKPKEEIRFSVNNPSTLSRSETVTKALVQQANNNYNIMQSALKKVTADLKGIRAAMRMQSDYDRKVVDSLLNLYNTLLQENGVWAQYMPDTTRRIATQIVHAIGKQNITEEVNTIMDHMVHAQAKAAQRQWDKLRQTPIDKINISGVVMQGKVALEGQHALKAMNDALQANLTIEQIEEQINQLMDMEDNATDESLKTQYKGQWIGLTIAAQHLERLQHLQEERQQLDLELQSARSNKALKPAARQQLVENIKQAMRDNYIEQAEAYTRSTQDLSEYVNTQEGRAKDFIRRQDANRDKIRSYAQRDLEGLATNPNRNRTRGNVARSIWDAFASPIRDLQSLLRLTGLHAPDGEGYLYNHFMRNWMDGADMERTGIVAASKTLDEKIAELTHGKYKTWEEAARKINDASHNMFGITMLNGVDGKDMPVEEEIPLNAGNALYIYAVNKMNDGRMKLNGMNITEEDVQALADKVREQFGQEILDVVDWVQSEYFSQLRNRYNPTHEALFGAPMDAIENYFPLRINANARQQNEDLSEPDTDAARLLAGTSTGAIKRRTRNSLPLDVRNADFFQEVIRHISQMERWNAFAQWNRDANILFSDINFRNRIKGMKGTIYGEGDKLYNYMKDAFRVAIGTYKPKTDTFSEITLNMAKGVTSAKINFRIFTALKQIASFPAFFTYMQDGVFVGSYLRNWLKPHETMKWAKENLPNFEKRVSKRDMGDMRLMQRSTDWQWNKRILEWSSKYGMFFNVFFDTLTCATGARAVYDSHLADYMKKGYSEEDARNRARQDAEQAFNTSQQSSEGAFMSAVQQDRNLVTAALTVFRTSPIQYTRNFMYHTRNLLRKFGEGKRDEQIAFRMGQYKNDGLNDEQARKAAEKDYNRSLRQDIVGFVVYGALLNILWRLVGQVPYLLFGDDDDKKKQILDDATSGGAWFSPFTGLLGGGIVESALDGNGSVADMFSPEMPFTQDIKRAGQYLSNDKYAEFASQALSVLMQSGTGFDPLTASDMVSRIVTTLDSEEELDAATQALRVSQALLSIPQSQYEQMLIDKVVSGDTDENAALEDYIRYQKIHTAPLTWWLRGEESAEKAEENAEKRFNKLLTERDKIKNPEDYEE